MWGELKKEEINDSINLRQVIVQQSERWNRCTGKYLREEAHGKQVDFQIGIIRSSSGLGLSVTNPEKTGSLISIETLQENFFCKGCPPIVRAVFHNAHCDLYWPCKNADIKMNLHARIQNTGVLKISDGSIFLLKHPLFPTKCFYH